jgi:hypothetical protein
MVSDVCVSLGKVTILENDLKKVELGSAVIKSYSEPPPPETVVM